MTSTKALNGFRPSRKRGSNPNNQGTMSTQLLQATLLIFLQATLSVLMQGMWKL